MFTRLVILFSILVLTVSAVKAQTSGPVRDPNALALASQALAAVAGKTALTDITIQASATYSAGSELETGTATLVARGYAQSLVTLNLTDGQHKEIRQGAQGVWVGPDGIPHTMLSHNNLVDASWFYPVFTLIALASDPALGLSMVGQETLDGQAVFHLVASRVVSGRNPDMVALTQRLSTMHLYLDATTLLPAALDFSVHPDTDTGVDIPVEIRFAAYQSFGGVQVPSRIQKYLNGSLFLDLAATNAAVNSGVSPSAFALPMVAAGGGQ